jgi:hypothetical protein
MPATTATGPDQTWYPISRVPDSCEDPAQPRWILARWPRPVGLPTFCRGASFCPSVELELESLWPVGLGPLAFDLMSWCIILFIVGAWVESLTACRGLCYSLVCYGVVPLTLTALCYGDVDVHLGSFLGGPWSVPTQLDMKSSHPA